MFQKFDFSICLGQKIKISYDSYIYESTYENTLLEHLKNRNLKCGNKQKTFKKSLFFSLNC